MCCRESVCVGWLEDCEPDFNEKRVVAELEFKGRIRCGTLLGKGLRLIRDKQVKRFYKNFKKLLTVLKQKAE